MTKVENAGDPPMTSTSTVRTIFAALCVAALFEATIGNLNADDRKGELAGVVVDLDGRPVANAKVWLETRPPATIASTTTSADGQFRLGPLPAVFRHVLLVDAPGFGREHREDVSVFPGTVFHHTVFHDTVFQDAANDLRVVVAPGRTVAGQVLQADGQPPARVAVVCSICRILTGRYLYEDFGPQIPLSTDAQGRYRLDNVPPCRFTVAVRVPGMALGWMRADILPAAGVQTLRTIKLEADVPIRGVVHDAQGNPLANIPVSTSFADSPTAVTDADGRFVLRGFGAKVLPRVDVEISAPRFNYKRVPVGDHASHVDITLVPQRWVTGRVVDADTGKPVAIKTFILCWFNRGADGTIDRGNCRPVPFEQAKPGEFRVAYRAPQNLHLTVRAPGYDDAEANLDERKDYEDITGVIIKARRNGSSTAGNAIPVAKIQGRLTRHGRPVTSAWVGGVRVRSERKLPYVDIQRGRTVRTEWNPFSFATASSSGGYSIELRNDDRWYVVVEEPNQAPTIRGPFEMKMGQIRKLDIELEPGGSISGHVRGIPPDAAGQWWVVAFDRGVWRSETRMNKDGSFRLDRLPAGDFGLKVGHDGLHDADNPDHPSESEMNNAADPWHGAHVVTLRAGQALTDVVLDVPATVGAPVAAFP
jgi:Carboxypeptidase regulatory-like domain